MFILSTLTGITDVLEQIRDIIIDDNLVIFSKVASVLAAMLAAWSYIKLSHDYMEGQGVTFWQFIRPVFIVILVINFNSYVLHPFHSVTKVFTEDLSLRTQDAQDGWWESMKNAWGGVDEEVSMETAYDRIIKALDELDQQAEEPEGFWEKCWNHIKKVCVGVSAAMAHVSISVRQITAASMSTVLYSILTPFMYFIYYCQIIICYVLLIIYGLLGPFIFSLSILERYSKGIGDWIARYIQTAFWIPIGQIVFLITGKIMSNISSLTSPEVGALGGTGTFMSNTAIVPGAALNMGSWIGVVMVVSTMVCILMVPKISSYIIESAGSGGVAQGVGGTAKGAAMAATKIITKV